MLNIWSVRIFTSTSFIPKFFETYFCQARPPIKDPGPNGSWGPPQHLDGHRGKIKCLSLLIWWRRSKTTIERLVVLNIYLNCTTKIKWRPKKIVRCPTGLGTLSPHLRLPTVTIVGEGKASDTQIWKKSKEKFCQFSYYKDIYCETFQICYAWFDALCIEYSLKAY